MLTSLLATFGPVSGETAVFSVAAVIAWGLAAFTGLTAGGAEGMAGRVVGLTALGLALWFFPGMWTTVAEAF